jgi:hypothetical protein
MQEVELVWFGLDCMIATYPAERCLAMCHVDHSPSSRVMASYFYSCAFTLFVFRGVRFGRKKNEHRKEGRGRTHPRPPKLQCCYAVLQGRGGRSKKTNIFSKASQSECNIEDGGMGGCSRRSLSVIAGMVVFFVRTGMALTYVDVGDAPASKMFTKSMSVLEEISVQCDVGKEHVLEDVHLCVYRAELHICLRFVRAHVDEGIVNEVDACNPPT